MQDSKCPEDDRKVAVPVLQVLLPKASVSCDSFHRYFYA